MSLKVVTTVNQKPTDSKIEDQIRRRAQQLFDGRNPGDGTAVDDWLRAEKEILSQNRKKAAVATK
jgi:hypothetical protein